MYFLRFLLLFFFIVEHRQSWACFAVSGIARYDNFVLIKQIFVEKLSETEAKSLSTRIKNTVSSGDEQKEKRWRFWHWKISQRMKTKLETTQQTFCFEELAAKTSPFFYARWANNKEWRILGTAKVGFEHRIFSQKFTWPKKGIQQQLWPGENFVGGKISNSTCSYLQSQVEWKRRRDSKSEAGGGRFLNFFRVARPTFLLAFGAQNRIMIDASSTIHKQGFGTRRGQH